MCWLGFRSQSPAKPLNFSLNVQTLNKPLTPNLLILAVTTRFFNQSINTYCFFLIVTLMEIAAPILALAQNIPTLPFALTPKLNSI